jgi:hypothetical protein
MPLLWQGLVEHVARLVVRQRPELEQRTGSGTWPPVDPQGQLDMGDPEG